VTPDWNAVHLAGDRNRARPLRDMEPERAPPADPQRISLVETIIILAVAAAIIIWRASSWI
jgi:hypothetical protein